MSENSEFEVCASEVQDSASVPKTLSSSKSAESGNTKIQVSSNPNKVTLAKSLGEATANITNQVTAAFPKSDIVDVDSESSQQFYIEVDATTAASLKAGTQFTLIPMNEEHQAVCIEKTVDVHDNDNEKVVPFIHAAKAADCGLTDEPPGPMAPKAVAVRETDSPSHLDADIDAGPDVHVKEEVQYPGHGGAQSVTQTISQEVIGKGTAYAQLTPSSPHPVGSAVYTPHFHHPPVPATVPSTLPPQMPSTPYPMHPSSHIYNHAPSINPGCHSTPLAHPSPPIPLGRGLARATLPGQAPSPLWSPYSQGFMGHPYYRGPGGISNAGAEGTTVVLNSSGEEQNSTSPDYPKVPHNTPLSGEGGAGGSNLSMRGTPVSHYTHITGPLDNTQYYVPVNGRETHNEKERKRRSRIKVSCDTLRSLVPGLSEKTDKATVFEYTVQYLLHLRRNVGMKHDKEFIERYSPY